MTMQRPTHTPRIAGHRGFTLVELMVATALSMILIGVLHQFSVHTLHMAETMHSRVRFNQEARLAMEMMTLGGVVDKDSDGNPDASDLADPYNDVTDEAILGFRGSANSVFSPHGNTLTRDGQRLYLHDDDDDSDGNNDGVKSNELSVTVDCLAVNTPHDDCTSSDDIVVNGMLQSAPVISDGGTRSYTIDKHCAGAGSFSPTVEVTLSFTDPYMLARAEEYIADEYTTSYRYLIGTQVDCH